MQKTLLRSFILALLFLLLIVFDFTKLKEYIGLMKVKEMINREANLFEVSKTFFGEDLDKLFSKDVTVNANIIDVLYDGNLTFYYQDSIELYSDKVGVVTKVMKLDDCYEITINLADKQITYGGLISVEVEVYTRVDGKTLLGYLDCNEKGFYYYCYEN